MVPPRWLPTTGPCTLEVLVRARIAERRDGPPLRKKLQDVEASIVRMQAPSWCESLSAGQEVRPFFDFDAYVPSEPTAEEIEAKELQMEEQVC